MKIIDAHTHIDYLTYIYQPDVMAVICSATMESEWQKIIDLIKNDNRVYGAFGIHPWFVNDVIVDWDKHLELLLATDSNYMIGEIGIDKYKPDITKQTECFIKQMDIAIKLKRTVFMHCVGAWDKILYILKQYKQFELPIIVMHGFNENEQILTQLLKYKNIYFSLGKNAVYGKNCRIEQIPINRILIESDGKNDCLLKDIVNQISYIKNDENVANIIYDNTKRILKNG